MSEKFLSSLSVDVSKKHVDLKLSGPGWSISLDRRNGVEVKGEVNKDELFDAAAFSGFPVILVYAIQAMLLELKKRDAKQAEQEAEEYGRELDYQDELSRLSL